MRRFSSFVIPVFVALLAACGASVARDDEQPLGTSCKDTGTCLLSVQQSMVDCKNTGTCLLDTAQGADDHAGEPAADSAQQDNAADAAANGEEPIKPPRLQ
jgi:hypothetical protein